MKVFYFVFFCVYLYKYADGHYDRLQRPYRRSLPPFITPCQPFDTQCMKASAQRALPVVAGGVPELGIEVLDPMNIERISLDTNDLQVDFRDNGVQGLKNCLVQDLQRDGDKLTVDIKCTITITGDYTVIGKLLSLPVEGTGKYKIVARDTYVRLLFTLGERDVNGVKYYDIVDHIHHANVEGGVEFNFENLFNGDTELSDSVHKVANSNWQKIFSEMGGPIVNPLVDKIINEVKKLFDIVPADELTLP